ncbi:hypothetical protein SAY87_004012 [Trapa incisa]|uniref:Bidirectional sugar transporter SWEET n=1 Tax=Trapa incisa TaxID=236973 RepID=A0AAN7PRL8_9MYRT|nr:hypothetical protein SAY87_004012 [Trapa incisa]
MRSDEIWLKLNCKTLCFRNRFHRAGNNADSLEKFALLDISVILNIVSPVTIVIAFLDVQCEQIITRKFLSPDDSKLVWCLSERLVVKLFLYERLFLAMIIKNKSVEEFKEDPYLATVLNCIFWILYGMPFVHPDSTLVVTINSVGLVLELIYLTIFFIYTPKKGRKKVMLCLLLEVMFTAVVATGVLLGLKAFTKMVSRLWRHLPYLQHHHKKVITTKSVKYMPFTLSLAGFLNACIWTAYALIKFDIYILISNGLGSLFGAAQLILYACYFRSQPAEVADGDVTKTSRHEIQLSRSNIV